MSLETFEKPCDLYLARGDDVNPLRPLFTGDVVADAAIPGVQDRGMAVVVAHPCSMRGKDAQLEPRALVASVVERDKIGRAAWAKGNFGLMPLPDLLEVGKLWVARLDDIGKALTADIMAGVRVACLSPFGVNLLQQRFIWRLTLTSGRLRWMRRGGGSCRTPLLRSPRSGSRDPREVRGTAITR